MKSSSTIGCRIKEFLVNVKCPSCFSKKVTPCENEGDERYKGASDNLLHPHVKGGSKSFLNSANLRIGQNMLFYLFSTLRKYSFSAAGKHDQEVFFLNYQLIDVMSRTWLIGRRISLFLEKNAVIH